jgi:NADH:ubiquinone oxidoreductase subunit 6 (subunit J)
MFIFQLTSSLIIGCAILLINLTNPVHSVLLVVLLFTNATVLLFFIGADFLAVLLILVYVGAITILFLFIVMMLDINLSVKKRTSLSVNAYFITFFSFTFLSVIFSNYSEIFFKFIGAVGFNYKVSEPRSPVPSDATSMFGNEQVLWSNTFDWVTNVKTLQLLYSYNSIFMLLAGIILLLALIGAIVLTSTSKQVPPIHRFSQTHRQVSRSHKNAIFLITSKQK